ncbi:MAG: AAA family ATPase [Succinatimonas sp.]|nr:AAA family ATPase [Succinatimonas sp.]
MSAVSAVFSKEEFEKLPRSQESFSALRRNGKIYVDKTAFIYDLAFTEDKYFIKKAP